MAFVPFGKERVSLTVAENATPYLSEAIAQLWYITWCFFCNMYSFYESVKHFNKK